MAFPPAELLQWAAQERRTGSLVLRRSRIQKRIFFDCGRVVACQSDAPAEFYGRFLRLHGYLSERELVAALAQSSGQAGEARPLGEVLVESGMLSEQDVARTLSEHIQDSICDLFLWQRGVFYFEGDRIPETALQPDPISTMSLVLEGTRWIDELDRIRKIFPHDNVILKPGSAWPGQDLPPFARHIAEAVDGRRTLAELHQHLKGVYLRILEGAYRLSVQEVLDIAELGEAGVEGMTVELSVLDLLLEQAAEEQTQAQRREPTVPWTMLSRYHPVWVNLPAAAELQDLSPDLQSLSDRFDGRSPLKELLVLDPNNPADTYGERVDFFLDHLHRGNLALYPEAR